MFNNNITVPKHLAVGRNRLSNEDIKLEKSQSEIDFKFARNTAKIHRSSDSNNFSNNVSNNISKNISNNIIKLNTLNSTIQTVIKNEKQINEPKSKLSVQKIINLKRREKTDLIKMKKRPFDKFHNASFNKSILKFQQKNSNSGDNIKQKQQKDKFIFRKVSIEQFNSNTNQIKTTLYNNKRETKALDTPIPANKEKNQNLSLKQKKETNLNNNMLQSDQNLQNYRNKQFIDKKQPFDKFATKITNTTKIDFKNKNDNLIHTKNTLKETQFDHFQKEVQLPIRFPKTKKKINSKIAFDNFKHPKLNGETNNNLNFGENIVENIPRNKIDNKTVNYRKSLDENSNKNINLSR